MRKHPQQIFVVGNPRSGTTMMGRILGKHPDVHLFRELHFFEKLWSPSDARRPFNRDMAVAFAAQLCHIQREGFPWRRGDASRFVGMAEAIVDEMAGDAASRPRVYEAFLRHYAALHGKTISCEHTPAYVYYLPELLRVFPRARVIHMVRDPRDVLLSQKHRFNRYLNEPAVKSHRLALHSWLNYHPITTSNLWRAANRRAQSLASDPRILAVRFEDVLHAPEKEVRRVCATFDLAFQETMLHVPVLGSSHELDEQGRTGIDASRQGRWRDGSIGLDPTELFLCQTVTGSDMKRWGYALVPTVPDPLRLAYYLLTCPLKVSGAVLMQLQQIRSIPVAVAKRLAGVIAP